MSRRVLLLAPALLALVATPALAHEVLHEVRAGAGVAVRVYESDGEAVAGASFDVWSPADPKAPFATGKTDLHGWLAFVPDAPGAWRLRVLEDDGHGLDVRVQVAPGSLQAVEVTARQSGGRLLGPLLGAAAIGAIFGLLALLRRRAPGRPAP